MIVRTHIVANNGYCERCGGLIPPIERDGKRIPATPGMLVGVIDGLKSSEASAYVIGEHDSNESCEKV